MLRDAYLDGLASTETSSLFWTPERLDRPSAWWGHVPFAFWIVQACRPQLLVELGTHYGVSYAAFCEAVSRLNLDTRCYAVDTWRGDANSGFYGEDVYADLVAFHDQRYAGFSQLVRKPFDEAVGGFADGSIDLLHLDGSHDYEAVRRDFETWRPKLSRRGVALFHDTNVRRNGFGVWRVFAELSRQAPSFEFLHCHGLGVLAVGAEAPEAIKALCGLSAGEEIAATRERFSQAGARWMKLNAAKAERAADAKKGRRPEGRFARTAARLMVPQREVMSADAKPDHFAKPRHSDDEAAQAKRALAAAQAKIGVLAERLQELEEASRRAADEREGAASETERQRQEAAQALAVLKRSAREGRLPRKLRGLRRWMPGRGGKIRRRGRDYRLIVASPLFDADWYLANNPDVAAGKMDPAYHYLRYGAGEGRAPGPHFNGHAYLLANPDVAAAGENPLLHFIRIGASEGRLIGAEVAIRGTRPLDDVSYKEWVRLYDTLSAADRRAIRAHLARLEFQPLISVVMPAFETPEATFRQAIESVRAQLYPNWELCVADDASASPSVSAVLAEYSALDSRIKWVRRKENGHISAASNSALDLASGEFVALMDHDDLIPPHALYEVVAELNAHPQADILYSDEDKIDSDGRRYNPYFKTDWNFELFLGQNFISHLGVYRRSLVAEVGGFRVGYEGSQDYDLALRCLRATSEDKIRHIPAILYHWRKDSKQASFSDRQLEQCTTSARKAKNEYLASIGDAGRVVAHPLAPYWDRVVRPAPTPAPLVSLIVPTRNRADLLGPCLDGLMNRTSYQPIEIIVIDHQSDEPEALALLKRVSVDPRVRILRYEGPFNFSAMNNRAVALARGEIVGLVNNDIDVINPDWLTEMVALAAAPGNGAVGAKLFYPDGRVQHGGVGIGIGGVGAHLYQFSDPDTAGYFGRLQFTSDISAVTAACLVVRKAAYLEVGGLNETDLMVAFNDVDFCLKLREAGYRNVWTPFATHYHHESPSRGLDKSPEEALRFRREAEWMARVWSDKMNVDPYFNANLSLQTTKFDLAFPPRRTRPWSASAAASGSK